MTDKADLLPCPFCGAGQIRIDPSTYWTGMSSQIISVTVMHHCAREDGQPQSVVSVTGRTEADAIRLWNTRAPSREAELREALVEDRGGKYSYLDRQIRALVSQGKFAAARDLLNEALAGSAPVQPLDGTLKEKDRG